MASIHIWVGLTASYTDRRDVIEKNYVDSAISLLAYFGTLLAIPMLCALWPVLEALTLSIWCNVPYILGFCVLLYFAHKQALISVSWTVRVHKNFLWLKQHAVICFTNTMYCTVLVVKASFGKGMVLFKPLESASSIFFRSRKCFRYSNAYVQLEDIDRDISEPQQFRLLRLKRKWPFLSPRADLEVHYLPTITPYYAISYVWGSRSQTMRRIVLNDLDHEVPGNVYDILLRCSSYLGERLIWIDSICIDQTNNKEKSRQVQRMRDIYWYAGQVLVCLGDTPGAGAAIQLLQELNVLMNTCGETRLAQYVQSFLERRSYDRYLRARVEVLLDFFSHEWFERVWIIQELAVPHRVKMFYGNQTIYWPFLHDWIKPIRTAPVHYVLNIYHSLRTPTRPRSPFRIYSQIPLLTAFRWEYSSPYVASKDLCYVLRYFLNWKATQGIDKIFSILGLIDPGPHRNFFTKLIDYNRPEGDTLLILNNHMVDVGDTIRTLDLAGIGWEEVDSTLPSWIVDWRRVSFGKPLTGELFSPAAGYTAATERPSVITRGSNEREIVVTGRVIDRIERLASAPARSMSEVTHLSETGSREIIAFLDDIDRLVQLLMPDLYHHLDSQPVQEAVWRTMIGDRTLSDRPAPQRHGNVLRTQLDLLRSLGQYYARHGPEHFFTRPTEDIMREFGINDPEQIEAIHAANRDIMEVDFLWDNPGCQRSFAVTKSGYIGMVPRRCRNGDIVCVLYGGKVPFILRKCEEPFGRSDQGDRYQLVGEAYVHGLMDGQGLEKGEETKFTLV
jgi:hypothetical protein